uniref:Transmembrane protein n=1 Tax=Parascaris univalens TaxID=6257 RepID=A0A915AUC9_PARUN
MPNGHVLKRPVSVLYTLEVSEEERETLPTAESKGFVKHPADQNLQAEEAEEEEEPSLKPPGQGTCTRYQFVLVMLFATFALASSARRTYSFTYAQNIATASAETILWDPSELADRCSYRTLEKGNAQISDREIRTKRDREITEEWALVTEEKEPVFDAPPFTDISEERLQWVLGMIDKNPQPGKDLQKNRESLAADRHTERRSKKSSERAVNDSKSSIRSASKRLEDVAFRWRRSSRSDRAVLSMCGAASRQYFSVMILLWRSTMLAVLTKYAPWKDYRSHMIFVGAGMAYRMVSVRHLWVMVMAWG